MQSERRKKRKRGTRRIVEVQQRTIEEKIRSSKRKQAKKAK